MKKLMILSLALFSAGMYGCSKNSDADNQVNGEDASFLNAASVANTTEIKFGLLAVDSAQDPGIKSFAQMMVADHTAAQGTLTSTFPNSISISDSLDPAHMALYDQIKALSGHSFDSAYILNQAADHRKTVILYSDEPGVGLNLGIRNFAFQQLPLLQQHLYLADSLAAAFH